MAMHQQEQQRLCASTERVMRRLMHWGTSGAFHRWREWVEEVHRTRNLLNKVLATLHNRTSLRRFIASVARIIVLWKRTRSSVCDMSVS